MPKMSQINEYSDLYVFTPGTICHIMICFSHETSNLLPMSACMGIMKGTSFSTRARENHECQHFKEIKPRLQTTRNSPQWQHCMNVGSN